MKNIIKTSLVFVIFFGANVYALTLKEAVDIALEKNFTLEQSKLSYYESLKNVKTYDANFKPKVNLGYSYLNTNKPNPTYQSESTELSAQINYNLFNGFADDANREYAKYLSMESKYSFKAKKYDIVLNTISSYIDFLDARNLLKTYNMSYKLYKEQYKDAKNKYDQGLIAKNDLLEVQVFMATAKQNVVKAKGSIDIARNVLSNYLGGKEIFNDEIDELDESLFLKKDYKENELDSRSELIALKMVLSSIKEEGRAAKGAYYPKLDLDYSYKQYYDTFGMKSMSDPLEKNQGFLGVKAKWNIYNGGYDENQQEICKIKYLKTKAKYDEVKLSIDLQFKTAKINLKVALQNLKTATVSLKQARENYNIVNNRFKEGISTSTDLTDANTLYTRAKQEYDSAYLNRYLAIATLDRIFERPELLDGK